MAIRLSASRLDLGNARLDNADLRGYAETQNALGNVSGSTTIDLSLGTVITATTTGATTWTVTNVPSATQYCSFTLVLTNGGRFAETWMSGTKWQNSVAPTLSVIGTDVLTFFTTDNGTSWRGGVAMQNSSSGSTLWMWGDGGWGATGLGDVIARSSPVQLAGTWAAISGSQDSSFMIKSDGSLWSSGRNNTGNLGDGTATSRSSPVQVPGTWVGVTGSSISFTLAFRPDNSLWSWGYNTQGQLATGNTVQRSSPVQIAGTWTAIAGGYHALAIRSDGTLWSWGFNTEGGLGLSDVDNRSSPVQIAGTWGSIAAGSNHSLALRTDNTLWAWGRNGDGQIGLGNTVHRSSPVQIAGTWSKIACGFKSSFAINTSGALFAWGANHYGELGQSNGTYRSSPMQIAGTWANVTSCLGQPSTIHVFAQKSDGSLFVWGHNKYGKLGLGDTLNRSSPVQLAGTWAAFAQGRFTSSGLKA